METHTSLLLYSVLLCLVISIGTNVESRECETMSVPYCEGLSYTETIFPNAFYQSNSKQATRRLEKNYGDILHSNCHGGLKMFLCLLYAPPCEPPRLPCRSLCVAVQNSCGPTRGWKRKFHCARFPVRHNCLGLSDVTADVEDTEDDVSSSSITLVPPPTSPPPTSSPSPPPTYTCTPMMEKPRYCRRPGDLTVLPNWAGHTSLQQAKSSFSELVVRTLIQFGCSEHLERLVCAVYYPECRENHHQPPPPCRHLCDAARRDCKPVLTLFNYDWPDDLHCERFPETPPCVHAEREHATPTPESIPPEQKDYLSDLNLDVLDPYSCVHKEVFVRYSSISKPGAPPEFLQFMREVQNLITGPVNQCRALHVFMCNVMLSQRFSPPCKSVCLAAKAECELHVIASDSQWPDQMCDQFPVSGSCRGYATVTQTSRPSLKPVASSDTSDHSGTCERIRLPTCQNLKYNQTRMPNLLQHDTQEEAYESTRREMAIIEVAEDSRCTQRFRSFVCAMAIPVCTVLDVAIPPCRALCEETMSECQNTFQMFNYQLPSHFRCDQFPSSGLCIENFTFADTDRPPAVPPSTPSVTGDPGSEIPPTTTPELTTRPRTWAPDHGFDWTVLELTTTRRTWAPDHGYDWTTAPELTTRPRTWAPDHGFDWTVPELTTTTRTWAPDHGYHWTTEPPTSTTKTPLPKVQYYCVEQTYKNLPPYAFVSITHALQPSEVSKGSQPRTNVFINIYSLDKNGHSGERCEWTPEDDLAPNDAGVTALKLQHFFSDSQTEWLSKKNFVICPVRKSRFAGPYSWMVEIRKNPLVHSRDDVNVHINCTDQTALKLSQEGSINLIGDYRPMKLEVTPEPVHTDLDLRFVLASSPLTPVTEATIGTPVRLVVSYKPGPSVRGVLAYNCWASDTFKTTKTKLIDNKGCPTKNSPISEFKPLNETVLQTDPFPLFTTDSRAEEAMDVTCSYLFCFSVDACRPKCDKDPHQDKTEPPELRRRKRGTLRRSSRQERRSAGGQLQSQTIRLV